MTGLILKNGIVYDPLNHVDGEVMDIIVKDGKIVEKVGNGVEEIDASDMIVMPGGVDIHSHIAGTKVNAGRLMRPEDHVRRVLPKPQYPRSGVGYSVPSTFTTGYWYSELGFTTVFEPATPPLKTRHTHEELDDIPMIDKGTFVLLGNNWFVMDFLMNDGLEECKAFVSWMVEATKSYAVKIVNPGGIEAWSWGGFITGLDDQIPNFEITPREIVRGLCRINNDLDFPHSIHLHTNNMARAGNYQTTIDTMDCVEDLSHNEKPSIHITHVQFTGRSGNSWANVGSGAPEIADYVNKNPHAEIDIGQIVFGDTTTMTADGSFQYIIHLLSGNKWINSDVEVETGAGVVPYKYRKSNYVNAIQWGIGLELALLIDDPWRVHMTTDHPNAGPFIEYPRVFTWLMSMEARDKVIKKINKSAKRKLVLPGLEREYSLYEIAVVTRAAAARSLGLKMKGHLGQEADADIAVYNIDPSKMNLSKDYRKVQKAFRKAAYTIKDGRVVVKDGEIKTTIFGKTFWAKSKIEDDLRERLMKDLKQAFREYYTIEMSNYPIDESYLANPYKIQCGE